MMAWKLAFRNLAGAGLRTWLNALVLSLCYFMIIWHKGLLDGWDRFARTEKIEWEIGGGQCWHSRYDPFDPFTLTDGHGPVPAELASRIEEGRAAAVLIAQGTFYPNGRMQSVLLKGIDPDQSVIKIPSGALKAENGTIPAVVGGRMAETTGLSEGDAVTVRWRNRHGAYDATEVTIARVFKTYALSVDAGQIWIPLDSLRRMMEMPDEATLVVLSRGSGLPGSLPEWTVKNPAFLLSDIDQLIRSKSIGGSVLYVALMGLAMLAIFDTQVLSIFRRQREIGMQMALGMTRGQVIRLFTLEGALHSILAAAIAAVYGIPFLAVLAARGFGVPQSSDSSYGIIVAEKIFPRYSAGLVLGTVLVIFITTAIVSYIPARKIAGMKPTEAIRGKIQ
ncbi:ABC transporter permease [bacterium]|nr:ABC transporter permease [bacterium]